jgi:hypothetical protein
MSEQIAYYPQSAYLESCKINLASGQQFDLKNMIVELSYFEDIFSFCTSGYIMIRDGLGLIEAFKLSGKEEIEIQFGKTANEYDKIGPIKYLIYKIGDRKPTGNMNSEFYKLYFCTKDLFSNETMKVSKSHKGEKIDKIVHGILTEKLKTERKWSIEKTTGYYDFIIPTLRPFEAISWLSNYARPEASGKSGVIAVDMFLFENRYGYNFRSLSSMMKEKPYNVYKYQQNNLDPDVERLDMENDSVIAIDFVKSFDTLKSVSQGSFANKIVAVDPITKSYTVKEHNYLKYINEIDPVNGYNVLPNIKNAEGKLPHETSDSFYKVVLSNSGEKNANYFKDTGGQGVAQDVYMQECLSARTAQVALANYTVLKIVVPGDINLTAGKTIDLSYYSLRLNSTDTRDLDDFYSGRYLITAARHILQSTGVYQTILEITKSSTLAPNSAINEIKTHK